jgi:hypothetical protein
VQGATVCRYHGGAAPQVIAKARERFLEAVDPALAVLERLVMNAKSESVRLRAALDILDRAGITAAAEHEHFGPEGQPPPLKVVYAKPEPRDESDLQPPQLRESLDTKTVS